MTRPPNKRSETMKCLIRNGLWFLALLIVGCNHHDDAVFGGNASVSFATLQTSYVATKCATCHSGDSPAGNLDFSTYRHTMDSGTIIAGKPEESQFYLSMLNG